MPAEAGVQKRLIFLDSSFDRNDSEMDWMTFYESIII
jgi:hypothetical protein